MGSNECSGGNQNGHLLISFLLLLKRSRLHRRCHTDWGKNTAAAADSLTDSSISSGEVVVEDDGEGKADDKQTTKCDHRQRNRMQQKSERDLSMHSNTKTQVKEEEKEREQGVLLLLL